MSILRKIWKNRSETELAVESVEQDYTVGKINERDCEGCTARFPASLKIDTDVPLFGTADKDAAQILVASGEHNWKHDIADEPAAWGLVCKKLSKNMDSLRALAGGKIKLNATDLDTEHLPAGHVRLIVLPQFLSITTTPDRCVEDVAKILQVSSTADRGSTAAIPCPERGFILLCSHATRDKRCGQTAPIMRKELEIELRHADLYRQFDDDTPGGIRVVYCSHVGGHKFAANCFIYQNNGAAIWLARVVPAYSAFIINETIQKGIIDPDLVRNCTKWKGYNW